MTPTEQRAVDLVARAIADDAGWEVGSNDYDMAVDAATVAVQALMDEGLLSPYNA